MIYDDDGFIENPALNFESWDMFNKNAEIKRLRQRVADLECHATALREELNKSAEAYNNMCQRVAELETAVLSARRYVRSGEQAKDAERYRGIAAAYARYTDPSCDDDKYTFIGTVGRIVEAIDA